MHTLSEQTTPDIQAAGHHWFMKENPSHMIKYGCNFALLKHVVLTSIVRCRLLSCVICSDSMLQGLPNLSESTTLIRPLHRGPFWFCLFLLFFRSEKSVIGSHGCTLNHPNRHCGDRTIHTRRTTNLALDIQFRVLSQDRTLCIVN